MSPPQIVLATTNPGKIREIDRILAGAPVSLTHLAELDTAEPPEETGRTFAENARLKADYYAAQTGLTVVAEDSGLVIDALDGRPGVHSARYPGTTYPDKFRRLYRELAPHARPWTARYICAAAVVAPADGGTTRLLFATEATVEGEIAAEPRGTNGFGYDPIFYYPDYNQTLGEVDDERKLAVAHRGRAFRAVRRWLESPTG